MIELLLTAELKDLRVAVWKFSSFTYSQMKLVDRVRMRLILQSLSQETLEKLLDCLTR